MTVVVSAPFDLSSCLINGCGCGCQELESLANKSLTNASTASSDDCVASSSSDASYCSDVAGSHEKLAVTAPTNSTSLLAANSTSSLPAMGGVVSPQLLRKTSTSTASPPCSPSHTSRSQYGKWKSSSHMIFERLGAIEVSASIGLKE